MTTAQVETQATAKVLEEKIRTRRARVGIIGLGFLFTFYDVFDINVSFIQSCVALKPGCTPENALGTIRVPFA